MCGYAQIKSQQALTAKRVNVREKYKKGQCYTLLSPAHATRIRKNLKLKPPNSDWF